MKFRAYIDHGADGHWHKLPSSECEPRVGSWYYQPDAFLEMYGRSYPVASPGSLSHSLHLKYYDVNWKIGYVARKL